MSPSGMDRREFHQLTIAALSGVIAGTTVGCGKGGGAPLRSPVPAGGAAATPTSTVVMLSEAAETEIMNEPHTCRGLNSCKELGRTKDNACAGQGTCASIADAKCSGQNDCKGQGGCGANPGMNDCKGMGGCHVPLMEGAWDTARAAFETAMKKNDKKFGPAPAKK